MKIKIQTTKPAVIIQTPRPDRCLGLYIHLMTWMQKTGWLELINRAEKCPSCSAGLNPGVNGNKND